MVELPPLFSVLHALVGVEAVAGLEDFVTELALVARGVQVSLHVLLQVVLGGIAVAAHGTTVCVTLGHNGCLDLAVNILLGNIPN